MSGLREGTCGSRQRLRPGPCVWCGVGWPFLWRLRDLPAFELQFDAGSFGEVGDRFSEVEGLEVHDELDSVPASLAPETVVEASIRGYAERWGLLLMVRVGTEACEAGALSSQGGELGGHLDDIRSLPELLDAVERSSIRLSVIPMYINRRHTVVWTEGNVTLPTVDIRARSPNAPASDYADLPPGIGFEPKDEPLRRDINLLGRVLGKVLIEQEGKRLFDTEEEIRLLCKQLRFDYDARLEERLKRRIEELSPDGLRRIVRAFSVYFQLVNIADAPTGSDGADSTSRCLATRRSAHPWRARSPG